MTARVEYMPVNNSAAVLPPEADPFRHHSHVNSHNHHEQHPWGDQITVPSSEFDALYAEANNEYMYHLWYTPKLAPWMATECLLIHSLDASVLRVLVSLLHVTVKSGIDAALISSDACGLVSQIQHVFDRAGLKHEEPVFVRLGGTSTKDSFAIDTPTAKPPPMKPDPESIIRRILTSPRCAARLLSLSEKTWSNDPGEALVVLRWSPDIELRSEFRVFCYDGQITAVSQDIWWEPMGWRERYSDGFLQAIMSLWEDVKPLLPFRTCTMDVLIQRLSGKWDAKIIEFGAFGAHLNTGSDLFHWINDHHILTGQRDEVTVRFVDDWENGVSKADEIIVPKHLSEDPEPDEKPDWLLLEERLRAKFSRDNGSGESEVTLPKESKFPLRGRWCSAY